MRVSPAATANALARLGVLHQLMEEQRLFLTPAWIESPEQISRTRVLRLLSPLTQMETVPGGGMGLCEVIRVV